MKEYKLSTRLRNTLMAEGILTKSDVENVSPIYLLKVPGIGKTNLGKILAWAGMQRRSIFKCEIKSAIELLEMNGYSVVDNND